MRFLSITYYELLKNIRDFKMALILILFPIIMIWPVGSAMGSMLDDDTTAAIKSGYVSHDDGTAAKAFESFLNSEDIRKKLETIRYGSEKEGIDALTAKDIDVLIVFPENADKGLAENKRQVIKLYGGNKLAFVENLTDSFTNGVNAMNAMISTGGKPMALNPSSIMKRISPDRDSAVPDAISYYSVLILLQQLFFGAMFGVSMTTKAQGSDIQARIRTLPVSGLSLTGGRIAGSTIYILASSIFTIIFTKIVYKANWDGNPLIIAGTMLIYSILIVGIGMLTGLLVKNYSMALITTLIIMLFFGLIAGTFNPSSALNFMNEVSPMYHAKILIFGTLYGYSDQVMLKAFLWLTGQMLAVFGVTALLSGRVGYDNI